MKLTNMIMIIVGLMFLLWLAGINSSVGVTLGQLGVATNPMGITNSWLFNNLTFLIGGAAVAGLAISFFTKVPAENLIIIPLVLFFASFASDWFGIILLTNAYCEAFTAPLSSCSWITYIVVAMIVPIGIAYAMAVVDWWRGRD